MTIKINGVALAEQPSGLNESPNHVYTDRIAINGNRERTKYPSKKRVEMTWTFALPSTVQYLLELMDDASPVVYTNTNSSFYGGANTFTGVLTVTTAEYQRGGTGYSALTVVIEEGQVYSAYSAVSGG